MRKLSVLIDETSGQRYVQFINRTYQRTGTLWDGRFKSFLTQEERYVLACYRYIELNPVRADKVPHPRDYPWSRGLQWSWQSKSVITPHTQYLGPSANSEERLNNYRGLIEEKFD
jgi:putative transposase